MTPTVSTDAEIIRLADAARANNAALDLSLRVFTDPVSMEAFAPPHVESFGPLPAVRCLGSHFVAGFDAVETVFPSDADFSSTQFEGDSDFIVARFEGVVSFARAIFLGPVDFTEARFLSTVDFSGARFLGPALFRETQFATPPNFTGAHFDALVSFDEASLPKGTQLPVTI